MTRPTIRLTVRSIAPDNTPTLGATLEVKATGQTRRVTTGPDGSASLVLVYEPGTTTGIVNVAPVFPAYGSNYGVSVPLSQSGPVDQTITIKHLVLNTPVWSVPAEPGLPRNSPYGNATLGADDTIYFVTTIPGNSLNYLVALGTGGKLKWVSSQGFYLLGSNIYPVVGTDSAIYVQDRKLLAFNQNGSAKGSSIVDIRSDGHVLAGRDGSVYVVSGGSYEGPSAWSQAFNPNLSLRWEKPVGASILPVIGADGALYMNTYTNLLKVDSATGATLWQYPVTYGNNPPVAGADGTVYVLSSLNNSGVYDAAELLAVKPDGTLGSRFLLPSASYNQQPLLMGSTGLIYLAVNGSNSAKLAGMWAIPTASGGQAAGWSSALGGVGNRRYVAP